jgi:hypothetical protein
LDTLAKNQVSQEKMADQIKKLKSLVGNVESASYSGFKELPNEGGLKLFQLNYGVKLSGGQVPFGSMQINVVDRPGGPGIVGFFIFGRSQ